MEQHRSRRTRTLPPHLMLAAVIRLDHSYSCISATAPRLSSVEEQVPRRFLKNAAVLPEARPAAPASSVDTCPASLCQTEEPVSIHGYSTQGYQDVYRSVLEPMMQTRYGRRQPYSVELGLKMKQRLWETLNCPSLLETEQLDGCITVTESFSRPHRRRVAPRVDLNMSDEPEPEEPPAKKSRR